MQGPGHEGLIYSAKDNGLEQTSNAVPCKRVHFRSH